MNLILEDELIIALIIMISITPQRNIIIRDTQDFETREGG